LPIVASRRLVRPEVNPDRGESASYTRGGRPLRADVHPAARTVLRTAMMHGSRWAILAPMKLVVAIVHSEDAGVLVDALLERDFRATRLQSSGGFLKQTNATVMVGVDDTEVDEVVGIVRENCTSRSQVVNPMPPIMEPGEFFMPYPLEIEVGGATVFVVPVERFERL
jgi:uncharacterized protein YaaQ